MYYPFDVVPGFWDKLIDLWYPLYFSDTNVS